MQPHVAISSSCACKWPNPVSLQETTPAAEVPDSAQTAEGAVAGGDGSLAKSRWKKAAAKAVMLNTMVSKPKRVAQVCVSPFPKCSFFSLTIWSSGHPTIHMGFTLFASHSDSSSALHV